MIPSLLLAVAVAAPAPKAEAKKEPPSVVGKWEVKSLIVAGKPRDVPAGSSYEFTAGGKLLIHEAGEKPGGGDTYTTDVTATPAEMTVTHPKAKGDPPLLAIYRIEGDTLTWAFDLSGVRPQGFESPVNSNVILMTFRRMKKE